VVDKAIAEGKTSFVFYLPDGVVTKKPSTWLKPRTLSEVEVTGWGSQLIEILKEYGLDTASVWYASTDRNYIQGYIKGTKPVDYGNAASFTWLDRPEYR
jgi:hypothetical protein